MGTLGCINDMLQRDKENRALRKRSRERMSDTRKRLLGVGEKTRLPRISLEKLEEIRQNTRKKEEADANSLFKTKLLLLAGVLLLCLLGWAIYAVMR